MEMQINQELCAGCGVCLDACSVGAIHLVDHRAVIDSELCTQCEACLDACPNGAITSLLAPVRESSVVPLAEVKPGIVPVPIQVKTPEPAASTRSLATLAGSALAFLGREVAPRLVEVLVASLEHRLTSSATRATNSLPAISENTYHRNNLSHSSSLRSPFRVNKSHNFVNSPTGTHHAPRRHVRCRGKHIANRDRKRSL